MGCHFLLQGIFLTQGLNLGLLLGSQILYHGATCRAPFLRADTNSDFIPFSEDCVCGKALRRESQGPEASAPGCRYLGGLTNPDAGHSSVHLPEVKLNPFYGFFSNWNPDLPKAGSQVSPPGAQMKGRCPGSARESGAQQEQLREGNLDGAQGGPLSTSSPDRAQTGLIKINSETEQEERSQPDAGRAGTTASRRGATCCRLAEEPRATLDLGDLRPCPQSRI